ncbi:MAG: hypothetical protein SFT94_05320 [Pseudanabaenaceae cyanobacterium bins.68]|nr:hypothetical protein [Pseudanabaenaceae cyanobacterium bins.68]
MIRAYFLASLTNLSHYLSDQDLHLLVDGLLQFSNGGAAPCDSSLLSLINPSRSLAYGRAVMAGVYCHDRPELIPRYLSANELDLLTYAIAYLCKYPQSLEGLIPHLRQAMPDPELELVAALVEQCQPLTTAHQYLDPERIPFSLYLFLSCPDLVAVSLKRAGKAILPVSALLSLHAPAYFCAGSSSGINQFSDQIFQAWAGMLTPPQPLTLIKA